MGGMWKPYLLITEIKIANFVVFCIFRAVFKKVVKL